MNEFEYPRNNITCVKWSKEGPKIIDYKTSAWKNNDVIL